MPEAPAKQPGRIRRLTSGRAAVETPRRRIGWIASAAALALAAVGFWTYPAVQKSLRDIQFESLRALLEADTAALAIWLENQKQTANALTRDRDISESSSQLLGIAAGRSEPRKTLLASRELSALRKALKPFIDLADYPGFAVVDRAGLILAAGEDAYVGFSSYSVSAADNSIL